MDRPRRRLSELSSSELSQRAIEYRRMALAAHGEATIKSLNMLAFEFAMLAAKREVKASTNPSSDLAQSEVQKLVSLAEQAAANIADPVRTLANTIRIMGDRDADPYLTMGVLIEGVIHTLNTRLPASRQAETASAILRLMLDRLRQTDHLRRA